MFIPAMVVGCLVVAFSIASLVLFTRGTTMSIPTKLLLLFGGTFDGIIGLYLLDWAGLSIVNSVAGGVLLGLMSMILIQPLLLPKRLVVWRLAKENILRRRRQSVLMVAGLVIASSIITSSLVVGDSLDQTVLGEVEASWDATDVLISGIDPQTGSLVEYSEDIGPRLWEALLGDSNLSKHLSGRQYGYSTTVSLATVDGFAEPTVSLFAHNATVDAEGVWSPLGTDPGLRFESLASLNAGGDEVHVVLNQIAAEQLEVEAGGFLELGAYVTDDGQRVRVVQDVVVHDVVSNVGQGAMAGTLSPGVFLDLQTAQRMLGVEGSLNRITISFAEDASDDLIRSLTGQVENHLDRLLTAEDVGIVFTSDDATSSLTISSETGLQRLLGEDVVALRENRSLLYPDAGMLEVLQAPLVDLQFEEESILTLADAEVDLMVASSTAIWHLASTGVGFEQNLGGDAWLWQVDDGDIIADAAWNASNQSVLIAHGDGLTLLDEGLEDEDPRAHHSTDHPVMAVAANSSGWLGLEVLDDGLQLHDFDTALVHRSTSLVDVPLPSTVLSYELKVDEFVHLRIESLLSTSFYKATSTAGPFASIDSSEWPVQQPPTTPALHPRCNGQAVVETGQGLAWCSTGEGTLRWNLSTGEVDGLRLPVLSDAPGFGRFPQMVLAFGGEGASMTVEADEVLTSERLSLLNLDENLSSLSMKGLLPYAYGNDTSLHLSYSGLYTALPEFEQLSDLDAVVLGLVNLSDAEVLALAGPDDRSLLMFSGPGFSTNNSTSSDGIEAWFSLRSDAEDMNVQVRAVKLDAIEQAAASSEVLSAMFLVFGTFTIAAGVLLCLTIIMLLADVRRKEVAALRALGLRRSDARAMFMQEGSVLAFVAGGLGSVLGLGLAWLIAVGFQSIFSSIGAQRFEFSWTMDSFLSGWIWGTLLSMIILACSAAYNAQLNIVRALRGGRTVLRQGVPWGLLLAQILALGGAGLSAALLLLGGSDGGLAYASYISTGVFLIVLVTPVFTWEIPVFMAQGQRTKGVRHAPRNTLGSVGLLFLLWTLALAPVDPIRQTMVPNELAFIVLGLFQVLSGVMVLTSLAPLAVQALSKRLTHRRTGPAASVALAHPLAHPVRTAVVIGMFSITMFSVVVLAGYTEQFDAYSADFVEEAEGEFELLLTSTRSRPITLGEDASSWGLNSTSLENIDAVGAVHRAPVHLEDDEGERMPYILRGVGDGFALHGGLPLHVWDDSLGATSDEAWMSILLFDDVVFLDASFGLESATDGATIVPLQFSIGDSISVIDFSNPQNTKSVRVGGFLKQSSYLFSPGVWMASEPVADHFGGEVTRMYVSVADSSQATTAEYLDLDVLEQGKGIDVRRAAAELESVLSKDLAPLNINVQTVADEVTIIQSLVLAILSLFEGYLALGLLVGVAGIGVVTVRNVSERRRTVGMLRAIGFRQRDVLRMFSIEVSWVSVLGMLNGLLVGYGFHLLLYNALWKDEGVPFSFPWGSTLGLFFIGWAVVAMATYVPVRQASSIPPSAALRSR